MKLLAYEARGNVTVTMNTIESINPELVKDDLWYSFDLKSWKRFFDVSTGVYKVLDLTSGDILYISEDVSEITGYPGYPIEFKMEVFLSDGTSVEYDASTMVSCNSSCDVFDGQAPSVGQCRAAQMKASLYLPSETIPKSAKCKLKYRILDEHNEPLTDWNTKGTFFVNKRSHSTNGVLTIECIDAMDKTNRLMYTSSGEQERWPQSDIDVVQNIADMMGVEIDPETLDILVNDYEIQYPGYGDGGYTMRQILGYIGAMYGGNWIITDYESETGNNYLKLLRLSDFPHTEDYLYEVTDGYSEDLNELLAYPTIGRVTINVGTNNETGEPVYYTAPNDEGTNGAELEFDCPWATQEIADTLYAELSDFVYYPYVASNVVVSPDFKLWDPVNANGRYTGITSYTRYFDRLFTADLSASGEEELDDEYPYVSQQELEKKRSTAEFAAKFILLNDLITSEVARSKEEEGHLREDITLIQQTSQDITFTIGTTETEKVLKGTIGVNGVSASADIDLNDFATNAESNQAAADAQAAAEVNANAYTDITVQEYETVKTNVNTFFQFGADGLRISRSGDESSILLSNSELAFESVVQDSEGQETYDKVAWISGSMFFGHNARFSGEVGFKSQSYEGGYYAFVPQSDGHLALKWINVE